jgi:hypothetical protein
LSAKIQLIEKPPLPKKQAPQKILQPVVMSEVGRRLGSSQSAITSLHSASIYNKDQVLNSGDCMIFNSSLAET